MHARDAEDLSLADVEAHAVEQGFSARAHERDVLDAERRLARRRRLFLDAQEHGAPDHHGGELLLGGLGRGLPDHGPSADHGDPVRDRLDLSELVGDEDDGGPGVREPSHDFHEPVRLLWGEDGRRLVEDEQLRASGQCLDDLHSLLDADGQVFYLGVGIEVEAELSGPFLHEAAGLLAAKEPRDRVDRLESKGDGLGDGEHGDEHEMLVDHSDARGDGVGGVGEGRRFAVDQNLALFGPIQPVQDVHEGRFARAVLAEKGVYLTRPDSEVYAVVGHERAESLGDPTQFQMHRMPNLSGLEGPGLLREPGPLLAHLTS